MAKSIKQLYAGESPEAKTVKGIKVKEGFNVQIETDGGDTIELWVGTESIEGKMVSGGDSSDFKITFKSIEAKVNQSSVKITKDDITAKAKDIKINADNDVKINAKNINITGLTSIKNSVAGTTLNLAATKLDAKSVQMALEAQATFEAKAAKLAAEGQAMAEFKAGGVLTVKADGALSAQGAVASVKGQGAANVGADGALKVQSAVAAIN